MGFSLNFFAIVAVACSFLQVAMAGAGAFMNGCIVVPDLDPPKMPFDVTFTAGDKPYTECMNSIGNPPTNMTVTQPGIHCQYLGYVESKQSGRCFFAGGQWQLNFEETSGAFRGGTGSDWIPGCGPLNNRMELRHESPKTSVYTCFEEDDGKFWGAGPTVIWKRGTQGPIHIVFQPFHR